MHPLEYARPVREEPRRSIFALGCFLLGTTCCIWIALARFSRESPAVIQTWMWISVVAAFTGLVALVLERARRQLAVIGLALAAAAWLGGAWVIYDAPGLWNRPATKQVSGGSVVSDSFDFPSLIALPSARCEYVMGRLRAAIALYATNGRNRAPSGFDDLLSGGLAIDEFLLGATGQMSFDWPTKLVLTVDSPRAAELSFVYTATGVAMDNGIVLAFARVDKGLGTGQGALFLLWHADSKPDDIERDFRWFPEPVAKQIISELESGQNPPPTLRAAVLSQPAQRSDEWWGYK